MFSPRGGPLFFGVNRWTLSHDASTNPLSFEVHHLGHHKVNSLQKPSALYRAELWQLGIAAARRMSPARCARWTAALADFYWRFGRRRRETVVRNVLPGVDNDHQRAQRVSRELYHNFSQKLSDLWQYEAGASIDGLFHEWTGWEHFAAAREKKRGILLVTPHLGNWEFGAPPLAQRGIKLLVITLAEPQGRFTQMRERSRARWGIETLVIGNDPFAFVEIIRRLEGGATVALLIDRPPQGSAIEVNLFGRPFQASIAAAELARASHCVVLPVYLPRAASGYSAHVLPAIDYDRPTLRDREARRALTQNIVSAFEPAIRQYINQWYHFVPIWNA